MLTYFVFIFFLSIVLYGVIQKKWMAGVFIVGIYALSSFCSILLQNSLNNYQRPTLLPTIIYCLLLFISLKPFIRQKPIIGGFKSEIEKKRFVLVGYVLSISVIIGMIIILPKITNAYNFGLIDARTAMYQGEEIESSQYDGFLMRIGSLLLAYVGGIWYLYIIMFFYALLFINGKTLLKVLLIVASLCQVESGFAIGGRTNALYWLLSFSFTLILFYSVLSKRAKITAISSLIVFFSIVLIYVVFITVQRSLLREGGTEVFLIDYAGQSYLHFCEFIDKVDWHPYTFERLLPIGSHLIGTDFNLNDYRDLIENQTGLFIGIFYTFMGDIFVDIGLFGLILFILLFHKVSSSVLRPNVFYFRDLCYLSLIYSLPLHGVFYYSLWKTGDFCILFIFLITMYITKEKVNSQYSINNTLNY